MALSNLETQPWHIAQARQADTLRRRTGLFAILPAAIIAMWRSTEMWFGYPSSQAAVSNVSPLTMQLILYSIIPFVVVAIAIEKEMVISRLKRMRWPVMVMCILIVAATINSANVGASIRGLLAVIILTVPLFLFHWRFGPAGTLKMLRGFTGSVLVINILYGLAFPAYAYMTDWAGGALRGMLLHKNTFGDLCAITAILWWPERLRPFGRSVGAVILCFLALVGVILSLSSTALTVLMLGIVVAGFLSVLTSIGNRTQRGLILIAGLLFLIIVGVLMGVAAAGSVAQQFGKDLTFSGRLEIWQHLWPAALSRPWLGHGFAIFRQGDYFAQFMSGVHWKARSTHNSYLEIILSMGFPVLFLWLTILGSSIWNAVTRLDWRSSDVRSLIRMVTIIIVCLVASFTEGSQLFAPQGMWPFVILALCCVSGRPAKVAGRSRVSSPAIKDNGAVAA